MSAADAPTWTDPGTSGPGVHESGLHVWAFRHEDGAVSLEIDADTRLTPAQARAFVAQLSGILDAVDPQHDARDGAA